MDTINHKKYMQRCIELAQKAFGNTYPNPMVGCVIVHDNKIIGEGYHKKTGENHAEIEAINSVENKELLAESILYVNLEPCSHYGKTPPCSLAIIQYKIPKVVIGCIDTYSEVSGRGIEQLKQSGIDVTVGILEQESRELNKRFFTFYEKKRPYIILKWAQTQDGFIDIAPELKKEKKGLWITDDICKKLVHEWRIQEQSILIGTNTAEIDNPQLTARLVEGKNPLRVVIDLQNRLSENLFVKDGTTPTIIFTTKKLKSSHNLEYFTILDEKNVWQEIWNELYIRNIQSIIIEGGSQILQDCIAHELWDEMRVFTGPCRFEKGVLAPKIRATSQQQIQVGNSLLEIYSK
jgi:diaminohydroxyphosphoribosylaminopyrimidine deaminase / 5-amino-6-(5-phosphoribosylamino)uracil reductase